MKGRKLVVNACPQLNEPGTGIRIDHVSAARQERDLKKVDQAAIHENDVVICVCEVALGDFTVTVYGRAFVIGDHELVVGDHELVVGDHEDDVGNRAMAIRKCE